MTVALAYNGHGEECICLACMEADFRATLTENGMDPDRYSDGRNGETVTATRTRYAKPGTRSGRGVVRLVSERQVRFMRHLLATRDTRNLVRLPGSEDIASMSLTGARDLIDRLLACPERTDIFVPVRNPMSEKQETLIRKLWAEKDTSGIILPARDTMTVKDASKAIDALFAAPRKPVAPKVVNFSAPTTPEVSEGMYRTPDGTVYKVQRAVHGSGNLYAKRLTVLDQPYAKVTRGKETTVTHVFEYAAGAIRSLTGDMRMTLQDAIEYGALYGVCCRCSRTLTDEGSIERGIGPVCAGKF